MWTQDADVTGVHQRGDALSASSIKIAFVFAVLDEFPGAYVLVHLLARNEEIFFAVDLSGSGRPRSICLKVNKYTRLLLRIPIT